MKTLLNALSQFTLLFTLQEFAVALPVMNENVALTESITIYPDHHEKNKYYVAPNLVGFAYSDNGKPKFSYTEFKKKSSLFKVHALIQTALVPRYYKNDLESAMTGIKRQNPNATFSALPFAKSEIKFPDELKNLVISQSCDHTAGLINQEQSCSFELDSQGRKLFNELLRANITFIMSFEYTVLGVKKEANNTFSNIEISHAVAAPLDGSELTNHDDLFNYCKRSIWNKCK